MKISTSELVELFGNSKQKEYYIKNSKIQKNTRDSIIETARTMYETVRIEKVGRKNYYIIENELEEPRRKEDGRMIGNARSIEYTKNMDIIVVSALENKEVTNEPQTLRKWLLDFGLINEELFKLLGGEYDGSAKARNKKIATDIFPDKVDPEDGFVEDFVAYTNKLKGQMERTLARMKRAGIIEFFESYKAKLYNEDSTIKETIYVTPRMFVDMNREKFRLLEIYNCTAWEVAHLKNKESVKSFVNAWDNYLREGVLDEEGNHVSIDFYYKVFTIDLKGKRKSGVMNYLTKFNREALEAYQEMTSSEFLKKNVENYILNREKEIAAEARKRVETSRFTQRLAKKAFEGEKNWAFLYVKKIHDLQKCYGDVFHTLCNDLETIEKNGYKET